MARRKEAEVPQNVEFSETGMGDAHEGPGGDPGSFEPPSEAAGPEQSYAQRTKRGPRGYWRDNEAGVRIEIDYSSSRSPLQTMVFREPNKLPAAAKARLREEGWQQDGKDAFTKRLDPLRRGQEAEVGDEFVNELDNLIRADKGLPERKSFYHSRS